MAGTSGPTGSGAGGSVAGSGEISGAGAGSAGTSGSGGGAGTSATGRVASASAALRAARRPQASRAVGTRVLSPGLVTRPEQESHEYQHEQQPGGAEDEAREERHAERVRRGTRIRLDAAAA